MLVGWPCCCKTSPRGRLALLPMQPWSALPTSGAANSPPGQVRMFSEVTALLIIPPHTALAHMQAACCLCHAAACGRDVAWRVAVVRRCAACAVPPAASWDSDPWLLLCIHTGRAVALLPPEAAGAAASAVRASDARVVTMVSDCPHSAPRGLLTGLLCQILPAHRPLPQPPAASDPRWRSLLPRLPPSLTCLQRDCVLAHP